MQTFLELANMANQKLEDKLERMMNLAFQWSNTVGKGSIRKVAKFPLTPMGVIAPGSAHARPSARPPIDISRKSYPKFRNPRQE